MEDYKLIPLVGKRGEGKFAKVDADDYEQLIQRRWHCDKGGYARSRGRTSEGRKMFAMHQVVLGLQEGQLPDHRNGNRLDNRKDNLRPATYLGNARNAAPFAGAMSPYKGIYRTPYAWEARIAVDGTRLQIGSFVDEIEAAKAYDACARYYFGEFARTNFEGAKSLPVEHYQQIRLQRYTSKYRGVAWYPRTNRWRSKFTFGGKLVQSYHLSEEDAAQAYDKAAKFYLGDKAKLNFPNG